MGCGLREGAKERPPAGQVGSRALRACRAQVRAPAGNPHSQAQCQEVPCPRPSLGWQEYIRHLIYEELSEGTLADVLRRLLRLPWGQCEQFVLKYIMKVSLVVCEASENSTWSLRPQGLAEEEGAGSLLLLLALSDQPETHTCTRQPQRQSRPCARGALSTPSAHTRLRPFIQARRWCAAGRPTSPWWCPWPTASHASTPLWASCWCACRPKRPRPSCRPGLAANERQQRSCCAVPSWMS